MGRRNKVYDVLLIAEIKILEIGENVYGRFIGSGRKCVNTAFGNREIERLIDSNRYGIVLAKYADHLVNMCNITAERFEDANSVYYLSKRLRKF